MGVINLAQSRSTRTGKCPRPRLARLITLAGPSANAPQKICLCCFLPLTTWRISSGMQVSPCPTFSIHALICTFNSWFEAVSISKRMYMLSICFQRYFYQTIFTLMFDCASFMVSVQKYVILWNNSRKIAIPAVHYQLHCKMWNHSQI